MSVIDPLLTSDVIAFLPIASIAMTTVELFANVSEGWRFAMFYPAHFEQE
jgi:hypothetical protein